MGFNFKCKVFKQPKVELFSIFLKHLRLRKGSKDAKFIHLVGLWETIFTRGLRYLFEISGRHEWQKKRCSGHAKQRRIYNEILFLGRMGPLVFFRPKKLNNKMRGKRQQCRMIQSQIASQKRVLPRSTLHEFSRTLGNFKLARRLSPPSISETCLSENISLFVCYFLLIFLVLCLSRLYPGYLVFTFDSQFCEK